ncbi:hypothetical protein MHYP_G00359640 [Metynnis hypsauchen]
MESEVEVTLEVGTIGSFKWTDANTADLIVWRVSNSNLFTGKRNTALRAFEQFVKEKDLEGKVMPAWVKKKWENLRQKYKDIKSLSLLGGDPCSSQWKWYAIMDQALSGEITITPSILSCPSSAPTHFGSPVLVSSSGQEAPPIKRRKEQYLLAALQELERRQEERERREAKREDERERRAVDREEERERRAMKREEDREKQSLERERRREQEMLARQERWERELLAREERREKEYREREERRDREAASREDRLFKLLETFVAKK